MTPYKKFLKYASLNIAGMLGISCYILADTFFVANGVGADGLAALNLAIPIYSFVHGSALMLGTGGATKYTIAKHQGESTRANHIFTHSMVTGLIFALIFMCCGLFMSDAITRLLRADAALYEMTQTYLKVILLFSPFFITNEILLAYVRNDGGPALAMTAMIAGSAANIILDYIFIYPMGMGIFGAVLATGIAPIVSILILSRHILSSSCSFKLITTCLQTKAVGEIMVLGFPALITELSAGIVMIVFNLLLMELGGNVAVAAYGIIANIALVTSSVFTGFSQGVQPLISEAYGKSCRELMTMQLRYTLSHAIVISMVLYLIMLHFASPITALFNSQGDTLLQSLGEAGMRLYFTSLPLTALNIVLCSLFTAAERPFPAHIISLLRGLIIVIPLAFFLAHSFGIRGLWLTITATEACTSAVALYLMAKFPITKTPAL